MNFLIMGAGAMGSVFGGFLAAAGHTVVMITRRAHADAIAEKGLLIDGIWGTKTVRQLTAHTSLSEISKPAVFDAILLTVKSYDTASALGELLQAFPVLPPVVSLQNGLGNVELLSSMAGPDKTIGGRMIFGVEFNEPGHVTVTVSADNTKIGSLPGGMDTIFVERLAEVFTSAGITTDAVSDIERYIWGKVLYNCALNALATIMGVNYGKLLDHEGTKEIMSHIVAEIFTVAEANGLKLGWGRPEEYLQELFNVLIPRTFDHHPSMLQDIQHGKKTEIDSLNGAIVSLGARLGIDVPYNWMVTQLVKAKEKL